VVFGPHPRSFALGMNKKTRRGALAMAIAAKADAAGLFVIDAAGLKPSKTKELIALLWPEKHAADSVLVVVHDGKDDGAREIRLAGRNLRRAEVIGHGEISAHAILAHDRLLVSRHALDAIAEVCRG